MRKRSCFRWMMVAGVMSLPMLVAAEPISFEQAANVTGKGGIEAGIDYSYSYQKIEQNGIVLNEKTLADMPVFVRVGLPVLEAKVSLPFGNLKSNIPNLKENNFQGLQDIGVQVKTGLLSLPSFNLALGVSTVFPTTDAQKYVASGMDLFPFAAADLDLALVKLYANLGYEYRGEYNSSHSAGDTVKINPGDALRYALGAELPLNEGLSLHAELLANAYRSATVSGLEIPDSSVTTYTFVPGIRMRTGPLKLKLGYEIPLEKKDTRDRIGNVAPTADWRVLAGASLQFSM